MRSRSERKTFPPCATNSLACERKINEARSKRALKNLEAYSSKPNTPSSSGDDGNPSSERHESRIEWEKESSAETKGNVGSELGTRGLAGVGSAKILPALRACGEGQASRELPSREKARGTELRKSLSPDLPRSPSAPLSCSILTYSYFSPATRLHILGNPSISASQLLAPDCFTRAPQRGASALIHDSSAAGEHLLLLLFRY